MNAARSSRTIRIEVTSAVIEEVLYLLSEFATHGIALCDATGCCRYANLAFQRITGYSLSELAISPLAEILQIHPISTSRDSNEKRFSILCRNGSSLMASGELLSIGEDSDRWELLQIRPEAQPLEHSAHWRQLTLQLAAGAAGIGTWDWDMENDTCAVSPVTASMLGLPPDCLSLPVQQLKDMVLPEDQPLLKHALHEALQNRSVIKLEFRLHHPEKGLIWLSLHGMSRCDEQGRPLRSVGIVMDITERKSAEERDRQNVMEARAAADANAKFRAFFYQGTSFASLLKVDGTLLETNYASLEGSGLSERQIVGRKFWQCGWWNRSRQTREQIHRACARAAAGHIFKREMPYFLADGSERICDIIIAPVLDEFKTIIYLAATATDITVRKHAEMALRASEERYRLLTEMSPDAILVEYWGRLVYANSSALELLGARQEDDLRGSRLLSIVPEEFHALLQKKRALLAKGTRRPLPLEIQVSRLNGEKLDVQAMWGNVVWEGKRAIQLLLRDISAIKRTQNKLRQVTERLKLALEGTGEGIWDWVIRLSHFTVSG